MSDMLVLFAKAAIAFLLVNRLFWVCDRRRRYNRVRYLYGEPLMAAAAVAVVCWLTGWSMWQATPVLWIVMMILIRWAREEDDVAEKGSV